MSFRCPCDFLGPSFEDDFQRAALVVALKDAEHRPLFEERHPTWTERVEFWHVHDVDQASPEEALPEIQEAVVELVRRLKSSAAAALFALYADPCFTFRFAETRLIPRFHLDSVPAGRFVRVFAADPQTLKPGVLLATGVVGEGGCVDLAHPNVVRAGDVVVVYPDGNSEGTRT